MIGPDDKTPAAADSPLAEEPPEAAPPERLSRKEYAKKMRHEAYVRAKEFRKTDPRQIAMQAEQKQKRRDAYQKAKERRKAFLAERGKAADEQAAAERSARQQELMALVVPADAISPAAKRKP